VQYLPESRCPAPGSVGSAVGQHSGDALAVTTRLSGVPQGSRVTDSEWEELIVAVLGDPKRPRRSDEDEELIASILRRGGRLWRRREKELATAIFREQVLGKAREAQLRRERLDERLNRDQFCDECGLPFSEWRTRTVEGRPRRRFVRVDRRYCSNACRQWAYRRRLNPKLPQRPPTDRLPF